MGVSRLRPSGCSPSPPPPGFSTGPDARAGERARGGRALGADAALGARRAGAPPGRTALGRGRRPARLRFPHERRDREPSRIPARHFHAAGLPLPRMHATDTIEGVKRGVLAGGSALGLLPEHAVEAELRDGQLAAARVAPALPSVVLRAVLAPGLGRSAPIGELIEGLRGSPRRGPQLVASASVRTL